MAFFLGVLALCSALLIQLIELFFERKESVQISWHLNQCQRIYQPRNITFEMRKCEPDADLIAEGSAELIGTTEILVGIPNV
jgi:hypothetical protein